MNMTFSMLKNTSSMTMALMVSTLMGMCSSSWILVWVSLEINTLAMCWMMSKETKKFMKSENSPMVYYLIQVMASIMILLISSQEESLMTSMIMSAAILMKMGVWPMHLWYMKLISSMEMNQKSMLVVMTWQKIMPVALLLMMTKEKETMIVILGITLFTLVTPLTKIYGNMSMKNIMALSSLNNNSWIVTTSVVSMGCFMGFLSLYSMTLLTTLSLMEKMKSKSETIMMKFWSSLTVVSNMGGLPPLTMFWAKLLTIKLILESEMNSEITMILMMSACYMLYHYLWMTLNEISSKPMKTQVMSNPEMMTKMMIMVSSSSVAAMAMMMMLGLT